MAYSNLASHGRKHKGGKAASSNNLKKGPIDKRKKYYSGHPSNRPTNEKTCLVHSPGHPTAECRVLKEYYNKYAVQHPHKYYRFGGKK